MNSHQRRVAYRKAKRIAQEIIGRPVTSKEATYIRKGWGFIDDWPAQYVTRRHAPRSR